MTPERFARGGRATDLLGREHELALVDGLLEAVRAGRSRALVIRGHPGVGKTALLEYAAARGHGCRVVRVAGVRAEMDLAFASLHQLCLPLLDHLEQIPVPQRDALRTAFGVSPGAAPDRFFLALAVLSLVEAAAQHRPLVCVVDDEHWLDPPSAQALGFVARRVGGAPVGLLFASRQPGDGLRGIAEVELGGLDHASARSLLDATLTWPLDAQVREQIVVETGGNPLALLELTRTATPADLAGGFALPRVLARSAPLDGRFAAWVAALPGDTRRLLQLAAADPVGEPAVLWRAAGHLGLRVDAAAPAAEAGLLEIGTHVQFRHPLMRSAAYRSGSPEERRAAHAALAEASDPGSDPDRRAWHRAQSVAGPDEAVARELERSATRALSRGGLAAAAAFLTHAARLGADPAAHAGRTLAAATAYHRSGAPDTALALLNAVEAAALTPLQEARVELLRGQILFASRRGIDAPARLLAAARRLDGLEARLARDTYLDALAAGVYVGPLAGETDLRRIAVAARCAPPAPPPGRPHDLLLDGLVVALTDGYAAGARPMRRAVDALLAEDLALDEQLRWLWLAAQGAHDLWDDGAWGRLSGRLVELGRGLGALPVLRLAIAQQVAYRLHTGDLTAAAALVHEVEGVTDAIDDGVPAYSAAALDAWQGRAGTGDELLQAAAARARQRGEGLWLGFVQRARAVLGNGRARWSEALAAAEVAASSGAGPGFAGPALAELVEAAVRSGDRVRATAALDRLAAQTEVTRTPWGLGVAARSAALLRDGAEAEALYRAALEHLGAGRGAMDLARAHLVYGEWLRRENRRVDAREQLRTAHELFDAIGAAAFDERARRELLATGATVRKRSDATRDELTAQELQIATLARERLTNPEIAARLFISPRTVEWHLHKVFSKLGIGSRRDLDRALPGVEASETVTIG